MATYLVTQATGSQSQWVITHLLAAGAKIHAVVRNAQKIPSILKSPGVTVFQGDSTNFEEIYQAAKGCKGVFLNTFPIPGLEAQQARTIAEAAKKAGVQAVVASTSFCVKLEDMWKDEATKEAGLSGYFSSKAEMENIVRTAGFDTYTILRPAFIHINYLLPNVHGNYPELPTHGELVHAFEDGVGMPQTDASDIGKYAAVALQDPSKFGGQEIELSNENFTVKEARDILVRVSGRDVRERKRTPEEVEAAKATVFAQKFHIWANHKDFGRILEAAKKAEAKFGIPFTPMEQALQREKDRLLECIPA